MPSLRDIASGGRTELLITLSGFDPSVTFGENVLNAAPRILDADVATGAVFAFTVTDGTDSVAATATLALTPVHDAPGGAMPLSLVGFLLVADAGSLADPDGLGPVSIVWQAQAAAGGWAAIAGASGPA